MFKSIIFSVITLSLFLLNAGCQSSAVQLHQAISATDLSVVVSNDLLTKNVINKDQATSVYDAAVTLETAEKVWDTANQTNNTTQIVNATDTVLNDLLTLETQLAAVQTVANKAGVKKTVVIAKTTSNNVSLSQINNIIQIVLELTPDLAATQAWINSAFSTTSVTEAQIQQDFQDLDLAESTLAASINSSK